MTEKWTTKARYEIASKPVKPGVWRMREGGYLVRGRVTDPHTGRCREVLRALDVPDAAAAYRWLQEELDRVRSGTTAAPTRPAEPVEASAPTRPEERPANPSPTLPSWKDFALSLVERKKAEGRIRSAHTRGVVASTLKKHLLPAFGHLRVDEFRRATVIEWKAQVALKIRDGKVSPVTANNWLRLFGMILRAAWVEHEIDRRCPVEGIEPFDTSEHPTYTDEEPNALTPAEAKEFMAAMLRLYPQHYGMVTLGFTTGLRPSSLRPLRRSGPTPDLLWDEGALLVRRSHTRGDEIMERTKTGRRQRIALPEEVVKVLRWHVDTLPEGPMSESLLLFPNEDGNLRSPCVLQKPFAKVAHEVGLRKRITPRAMRRTFQDLARAALLHDVVTRAVSGHATETMQQHYSTVDQTEMRQGLGKVIALVGLGEEALPKKPPEEE